MVDLSHQGGPAVRITGIDHVVLRVADVERSVAWYHDLLGLAPERLEEWRRKEVPFVSLRVDDTTLVDLLEVEPEGCNVDHVAFLVAPTDLDALVASDRFEVEMGPADLFGAQGTGRGVYVVDPDGHRVELRTY